MTKRPPGWIQNARDSWTNRGGERPPFADDPGPDQESVWDYPRPPAVVADRRSVVVGDEAGVIAATDRSIRILETSHPPTFYVPPESLVPDRLTPLPGSSFCEWKGAADYLGLVGTDEPVGWRYPTPFPEFSEYAGWVAFYPGRVRCTVDGEVVRPQAGGFYGGWITDDVVGPFKGEPETSGW